MGTANHLSNGPARPNLDDNPWLRRTVAWFPFIFVAVMLGIKTVSRDSYRWLIREDGVLEWATALAFIAAVLFSIRLARRLAQDREVWLAVLYGLLALALLFATLEEISWGQRVFGLETPEYFVERSTKPEINVHNLRSFPLGLAFIAVGCYGAFSRLLLPVRVFRRFPLQLQLLTPRREIVPYFLLTFALYVYYEVVYYTIMLPMGITVRREYGWGGHLITGKDQEVIELLLAIGFMLFVFDNWLRYPVLRKVAARTGGQRAARPSG